jgi:hypothetical protein
VRIGNRLKVHARFDGDGECICVADIAIQVSITIGQSHPSRSGGKGASLCDVCGRRVEFGLIRWEDEASTPFET